MPGCGHDEKENRKFEDIDLSSVLPQDFLTPEVIWKLILNETEEHPHVEKKEEHHGEHNESSKLTNAQNLDLYSIVFSTVDVILEEKNPGILKYPQIKVSFPRGGGELDFKDYLTGRTGTFFIKFVPTQMQGQTSDEVIFWSRAKKRRIESEIHGSGCNKILKMGSKWKELQLKKGIEVNTHSDRYLSVLGGHLFFVSRKDKEVYLSQISLTHSNKQELFCK